MNELKHLAIIMDGNGRWAKSRLLDRTKGHEQGAKVVDEICKFCAQNGIKTLSLYAFSTENWKRPKSEVGFLMKLLKKFIINETQKILENGIKFETIGDLSKFSQDLLAEIEKLKNLSKENSGLNLVLALNYGGKDEIIRAVKKLNSQNAEISEKTISEALDTAKFGDVDLLIRTGGEKRLSNFMLWEASYAELYFTPTLWPDFGTVELADIIAKFKQTKRRFGGL